MNIIKWIFPLSILCFTACSDSEEPDTPVPTPSGSDLIKSVTIDAGTRYQTIDGFAASDCWSGQYVGQYWNESEKSAIAKLLFSQNVVAGNPEGIGLSMWRFNLGGGTAEQGDASNMSSISRRAESFLQADGSLDWTHAAGQQYFLQKAKEYGCSEFVMFSNTPPVNYTRNGKGYSASGGNSNLKYNCYTDFADYMATVAAYFKTKGINFSLISPVNEPQYQWNTPDQEGSGWTNNEIKRLTVELDKSISAKGLTDTKILLAEAGSYEAAYKNSGDATHSDVINQFFNPSSSNYVGNLTNVAPIIGAHGYWMDGNWAILNTSRTQIKAVASAQGIKVYQTEWSMLGDGYSSNEGYPGHSSASYMDMALYLSKVVYSDLALANVSSWSYWTSMDCEQWDHKCRFHLIRLIPAGGDFGDVRESGSYRATPNLWVLGNYSLFVRPGYQRVDLNISNPSTMFFGTAFISSDGNRIVAIYTNLTKKSITIDGNIKVKGKSVSSIKTYTTNAASNLKEESVTGTLPIIPASSVQTIIYELK